MNMGWLGDGQGRQAWSAVGLPPRYPFSTNHLADIDKTNYNYNQQQHKNLNNRTCKLKLSKWNESMV